MLALTLTLTADSAENAMNALGAAGRFVSIDSYREAGNVIVCSCIGSTDELSAAKDAAAVFGVTVDVEYGEAADQASAPADSASASDPVLPIETEGVEVVVTAPVAVPPPYPCVPSAD